MAPRCEVTEFYDKCWRPITITDFGDQPMTFETEQSLRDHCNKTGLACGALL